ncbi:50S ribosomal protein L30 [Acidiplasma sp.]|uniref:50S ribosomal protein L30 n=1 Tax=Acidiplasma sp. TaxID=1872114 RepID=UPI00258AE2D6|nr:50S ribosomal protein L30 [Acidiplasma sp.]
MIAIVRIRGSTGIKPGIEKTLELLNLHSINHMVVYDETPSIKGMLQIAKDYLTWGEVDADTLELLLENRILLRGRKKIDDEHLKAMGFSSYRDLADAIISGKVKLNKSNDIIPVIRLNPPKGGYEAIQKQYKQGGSAGYRGKNINELIKRMIVSGVDLNGQNEN